MGLEIRFGATVCLSSYYMIRNCVENIKVNNIFVSFSGYNSFKYFLYHCIKGCY